MKNRQLRILILFLLALPVSVHPVTIEECIRAQIKYFHDGGSEGPEVDDLKSLIAGASWWEMREAIRFEVKRIDHGQDEQPTRLTADFQSASKAFDILKFEGLIRFYSDQEHLADHSIEWSGRATADGSMSHSWDCEINLPAVFDLEFIPTLTILHTTDRNRQRLVRSPTTYAGYVVLRDGTKPPDPVRASSSERQLWMEQRDAEIATREAGERAEAQRIALLRQQQHQQMVESLTPMGPLKSTTPEARAYESKWRDHARDLERELLLAQTTNAKVTFQHPLNRRDRREFDFHTQSAAAERVYRAAMTDCLAESMEAERIDGMTKQSIQRLRLQLQEIQMEPDEVSVSSSETTVSLHGDETGRTQNHFRTETTTATWMNDKEKRLSAVRSQIRAENALRDKYGLPSR